MRPYPRNSPEAAARILSLAALADGSLSAIELETLDELDACAQLGLHRIQLQEVMRALCVDLLNNASPGEASICRVAPKTMAALMAEVDDPQLRLKVLQLCIAVIEADQTIEAGESLVLLTAVEQWNLHAALQEQPPH
ncbi:TerB family tellurite resistance protein [Roseateles oligotrophus]|uniref:TerB family tellurite resistance protein n=1 Tax=Roseateles oligotrophus TaxID=1769250 RepID=A0ABT2YIB1_9BURK|nr:TerB family tellurite resistance protein [Roseateles oligotrophus]MCV2369721.1 TerB family tellurite resistance protein [Roseateles oligotrophus]